MSYRDPEIRSALRCPKCGGSNLTTNTRREHICLDCMTRSTDETALTPEDRAKFIHKMPDAVINWRETDRGRTFRMCLRCFLYLNSKYEYDASLYTRRQIEKFEAVPDEDKCDHWKKGKGC